jgi:hypothetical protein
MSLWSRIAISDDMSKRMADKLGLRVPEDFGTDIEAQAKTLRDVTLRCAVCSEQKTCAKLLNLSGGLEDAPRYCRNHDLFQALKGT